MISALVLAAGLSTRMGRSKPLLPFGEHGTVIEHIVAVLLGCPVEEIVVVTGYKHADIRKRLADWPVRTIFNPRYATGEMLASVQTGLRSARPTAQAALVVLGDQPALEGAVVKEIIGAYRSGSGRVLAPSYQGRRGHPLLIDRVHWGDILALGATQSLRDFMLAAADTIHYVEVKTTGILRDMDTPDDYRRELEMHEGRLQRVTDRRMEV